MRFSMLEVIAETMEDALRIDQSCANRIELVSSIDQGGLTPNLELIESITRRVSIPVRVMIRPHSESFVYDKKSRNIIFETLEYIKNTKAEGIVFGALKNSKSIDFELLDTIVKRKKHLKLTFHRAIDALESGFEESLNKLIEYPVDTVLTSMNGGTATENIERYKLFKIKFDYHNVELLAGSGLNANNIEDFIIKTKISSIHIGKAAKIDNNISVDMINKIAKLIERN